MYRKIFTPIHVHDYPFRRSCHLIWCTLLWFGFYIKDYSNIVITINIHLDLHQSKDNMQLYRRDYFLS